MHTWIAKDHAYLISSHMRVHPNTPANSTILANNCLAWVRSEVAAINIQGSNCSSDVRSLREQSSSTDKDVHG